MAHSAYSKRQAQETARKHRALQEKVKMKEASAPGETSEKPMEAGARMYPPYRWVFMNPCLRG
jgi:hypothetical protein